MPRGLQNRCGGLRASRVGSIPTSSVQTISGAEGVIMMGKNQELLRKLPKIDEMLQDEHLIFLRK